MEIINMKEAALNYATKGIPVFPMQYKKNYQINGIATTGSTDHDQVEEWWRLNCNIGMPTGTKSGVTVLSFATEETFLAAQKKGIPLTPIATNGKGYDVYFKYQDGLSDLLDFESLKDVTLYDEGKYRLLPPSVIELYPPSRLYQPEVYSWCEGKSLADVGVAEMPMWMRKQDVPLVPVEAESQEALVDVTASSEDDDFATEAAPGNDLSNSSNVNNLEGEWEAPKLFDRYHVEGIKADVLPSWLGDYARAISESRQTPEGLAVMLGLSMIATCVQKKFVVAPCKNNDYTEQLALWTVTVMKSGERKSPILNDLRAPLVSWQKEQAALLKNRIIESSTAISIDQARIEKLHKDAVKQDNADERQKRLDEINEIKRAMPVQVKAPVLWTGDVTAEELQDMLAEHGERMAVFAAEGNIFEVMGGLYNEKVNIDIFLQAYSGEPTRINRRSRKAELDNPALTFGMAVQPVVIEAFAKGPKAQFRGKGALARFLYCIPEPMVGQRDTDLDVSAPEEIKVRYEEGIKELLSIPTPNVPTMLTLDDEAFKVYKDFDRKIEKSMAAGGDLEQMSDWGGKLPGNALRIAGLMHLVEHGADSTVIGRDTMVKAVRLCELLIEHAKAAFTMAGAYESSANGKASDAKKIFHWMQDNGFADFDRTDCYNRFKSLKKDGLELALSELERRHLIREQRVATGGKDAMNYISNPALFRA